MSADTPTHETDPDATTVRPAVPVAAERPVTVTQPPNRPTGQRSNRPVAWVLAGAAVGALAVLYLVGYLVAGDKLPKDAQISGVALGGLSRAAAVDKLTTELAPRVAQPIDVAVAERTSTITPADAGLQIDYQKSVDAAGGGRSLNPAHIVTVLTGGSSTEPELTVDESRLDAGVQGLATTFDRAPTDAQLAYAGAEIKRTPGTPGVTVRQDEAATAIRNAFPASDAPVELPVVTVEPAVTTAEVDQVVADYAKPAVSGPIRVKAGGAGTFALTPAMIGGAITFAPANGTLTPNLDAAKLRSNAAAAVKKVELSKPKDATVRLVNGKPKVIPAVDGTSVGATELAKAVAPVLTKTGSERTAEVKLTGSKAGFTTEEARQLGIKEVTGEFTTYFPYLPYRNINLGRAAEKITGTVLEPGETFSLNKVVGERTKANGFTEGFIIKGGKFKKELGGGVSQSATTTYNAMFFAGLKDIQHRPHTLYIDRYPAGREATVAWPNLDLKFQNNTKYGVLVQSSIVKGTANRRGSITVKMWSTKTYDKISSTTPSKSNFTSGQDVKDSSSSCEPMSPVQGFDAAYARLFYRDGHVVKRENFRWRYAPTNKVTCT